jgi:hypothetical protein
MLHSYRVTMFVLFGWMFFYACKNSNPPSEGYFHKDLSEQMDALQVYQGSIGEEIKRGTPTPEDALWFVDGMDSVLHVIMDRINEHRNLKKPFSSYYEAKLEDPIEKLRTAISNGDTAASRQAYGVLVRKCNSCHNEHDVEERAHY